MFTGSMPAITPAKIVAVITFVVSQAVAFGWLDTHRSQVLLSVAGTVVAAVWPIVDAYLRAERAKAVAANPSAFHTPAPSSPPTVTH